jgi:hypothetical protein
VRERTERKKRIWKGKPKELNKKKTVVQKGRGTEARGSKGKGKHQATKPNYRQLKRRENGCKVN